jgi:gamma-glutamyltranspeptidase/glutathione hydrolase/leukotriene-C4 hydrolase
MRNLTEWSQVYYPNGVGVKEGDIVKRPTLADTLEIISRKGADEFYEGEIAKTLVNTIQSAGGIVTLDDFKSYRPIIRRTMSTYYNGRKITTTSEPTSGPVLLSVLNLIERFQFKVDGLIGVNLHRLVEAFKFGYAFRTEMGDPDFIHNEERMNEMVTKDYASNIRQKITVSHVCQISKSGLLIIVYRTIQRTIHYIMNQNLTMLKHMVQCIFLLLMKMMVLLH